MFPYLLLEKGLNLTNFLEAVDKGVIMSALIGLLGCLYPNTMPVRDKFDGATLIGA